MPRYFYDTEFQEDGREIDLISIGIVCEDGRELYLQSVNADYGTLSTWVRAHVLPNLVICPHAIVSHKQTDHDIPGPLSDMHTHWWNDGVCPYAEEKHLCPWRTRQDIKEEVLAFLNPEQYGKPELWGYYSAYDHVVFCQLFGMMIDLPAGYPMYTRDLQQWADQLGCKDLPKQEGAEHNALEDARWNKQVWHHLHMAEIYRWQVNSRVEHVFVKGDGRG
ncbi:MAG TPA: 3'-5' exoribonuclease [Nitrososphaera sp.]|nr:3'-5' exoribonuclease [Nitrososphaera sp.]